MKPNPFRPRATQRGFSLIEILITLVITAFGLIGLAGFVTKASTLSADAAQRARAAALLTDMTARIASNKAAAADYVTAAALGEAEDDDCAGAATLAARDLCEWNNLLVGTQDANAAGNAAQMGFRGCVTQPVALDPVFVVTVAWGSLSPGVPPADLCAQGDFGDDSLRRVVRSLVRVADLDA